MLMDGVTPSMAKLTPNTRAEATSPPTTVADTNRIIMAMNSTVTLKLPVSPQDLKMAISWSRALMVRLNSNISMPPTPMKAMAMMT